MIHEVLTQLRPRVVIPDLDSIVHSRDDHFARNSSVASQVLRDENSAETVGYQVIGHRKHVPLDLTSVRVERWQAPNSLGFDLPALGSQNLKASVNASSEIETVGQFRSE